MYLAPSVFTRRHLGFALSKNSASVAAQCARVNVRCCCSSRRELRVRSNRLTTGTANYTSRLLLHRPSWPTGNPGSEREESKWKRSEIGNWEDGASTFATRIDIWSNSPRRAHGRSIETRCPANPLTRSWAPAVRICVCHRRSELIHSVRKVCRERGLHL